MLGSDSVEDQNSGEYAANMGDKPKSKAFNRKPVDTRLVRQVVLGKKIPKYWVPMDIYDKECKIMEVTHWIKPLEKFIYILTIGEEIFCCLF